MGSKIGGSRRLALSGFLALALLVGASEAAAQTGGSPAPGSVSSPDAAPGGGKPRRAKLIRRSGRAIPPRNAPPAVVAAIEAGNRIHKRPYVWGGGHASFESRGYDCSGAVSYVLHAAGLLASPMPSGPLASSWGTFGKGRWISVFANAGHAYMVVAGLRFDTSQGGDRWNQGSGPRWRKKKRRPRGFTVKHYPGY